MSGSRYKWEKDAEEDAVSRKLAILLKDAVSRKNKKLSFETVYNFRVAARNSTFMGDSYTREWCKCTF